MVKSNDAALQPMGWKLSYSYAALPALFYAQVLPVPVAAPRMVVFNDKLAETLGLDAKSNSEEKLAQLFAGNILPEGAEPLAQAYAGHQFGHFTMLGDGRAHLLGEQKTPAGAVVDVQFKGSGRTPYSRRGDGRAALGPMLREYLISEAMHALGIHTTRSLAVVATGEPVFRETALPGAILTRVAASHLRVGTFEYAAVQGGRQAVQALADYAISRHYPQLRQAENPYVALLHTVCTKQAELVARWMLVGFVHGVMNTDNMTISGETIDYGPCAFMDVFAMDTVFSSIDRQGRYAYGNQPTIAQWNLSRLAEALLPLLDESPEQAMALAEKAIESFSVAFNAAWLAGMRAKLGLKGEAPEDLALMQELLEWMEQTQADYTSTFRALSAPMQPPQGLEGWYARWQARQVDLSMMQAHNPVAIPRNHHVEEALAAAEEGNMQPFERLLKAVQNPYRETPENAPYRAGPAQPNPNYRTFCGT